MSHFYYGYDYYSSSYGGVFLAVICFISDCGPFPDGASSNVGSVWSGSTTTLDAKRLWSCYWPCLCATAATTIFDASSGLCQLCYRFFTGRFLFRVEPPTILYILCWCPFWCLLFIFRYQVGCCINLWELNH